MRLKTILGMVAAVLLLAACETAPEVSATTGGEGGGAAATQQPATVEQKETVTVEVEGPAPGTQEQLTATYGDRVFFDFDKSDLKPEARRTITGWADWLRQFPDKTVTIEGHADERGTREYNLALGDRRANAVKNFMIALGIDPNRVGTISYGKERPAVLGSNEWAWAQNRRGVIVVN